jgi:hypothetical protein
MYYGTRKSSDKAIVNGKDWRKYEIKTGNSTNRVFKSSLLGGFRLKFASS